MKRYEFELAISAAEYLDYYRGTITQVIARTKSGVVVQFPARLLRDVVTEGGVRGRFELVCDENLQGARISRLK